MNGHGHEFGHEFMSESILEAHVGHGLGHELGHGLGHVLGQSHALGHGQEFTHGHIRIPWTRRNIRQACPLISGPKIQFWHQTPDQHLKLVTDTLCHPFQDPSPTFRKMILPWLQILIALMA